MTDLSPATGPGAYRPPARRPLGTGPTLALPPGAPGGRRLPAELATATDSPPPPDTDQLPPDNRRTLGPGVLTPREPHRTTTG